MYIDQLNLILFRHYHILDISFDNKINVIIVENSHRISNLIEAIYLLTFTKSHRTPRDKELIMWDKVYAKIDGRITKRKQNFPLEIIISTKGKKAKLNHIEQKRLSHYIGALNV